MKNVPRWVKIPVTIGIILGLLFLIWLAIRTIFPLPVKNAIEISEREIVIDSYTRPRGDFPAYDTYFAPLNDGRYIYLLTTDYTVNSFAQNVPKDSICRIYLLSEDFDVIKSIDEEFAGESVFALNNGNFSVAKRIKNDDETYTNSIVEYSPELEFISEKTLPVDVKSRMLKYCNGRYYNGFGDTLQILDEDLNILKTYNLTDFPEAMLISFSISYDNEAFVLAAYNVTDNENNFPTRYMLRPVDGGKETQYSLASDMMGDITGNHIGDERYAFYTKSTAINESLMWAFLKNIRGDFVYGLNKDGSFKKIGSFDWRDGNKMLSNYYYSVPYNGKRYYTDADDVSLPLPQDFEVTVYLYEYTGTYPN